MQSQKKPVFVVGTGRCGSTLLSNILKEDERILSLSEFFISLSPFAFHKEELDGKEFWDILATPRLKATQMVRYGIGIAEFLYQSQEGTPPILLTTLPHISREPEQLFLALKQFVQQLSEDQLANQYLRLFEWLCRRFNKQIWVERSGGSLGFIPSLLALFPNAKFVHITRDGRECAMSMSRHNAFRLLLIQLMVKEITGLDPYISPIPEEQLEQLGELTTLLPDRFDVAAYHNFSLPVERFGYWWSSQIITGLQHMRNIPQEHVLNLRYEDLLSNPREQITRLFSFIIENFDNEYLIERASSMIEANKTLTWIHLEDDERKKLFEACEPGLRLLKYI